jgi:type II secretory pathway component PulJ
MLELMVSTVLVLIAGFGATNVYLSWNTAKRRADQKVRLQEDATQGVQYLVRSFRNSDSVHWSGSGVNDILIGTFDAGNSTPTDCIFTVQNNGRYYLAHNGAGSSGDELIVPSPIDSFAISKHAGVVRIAVRLADTTGNKVTTVAAANYRN